MWPGENPRPGTAADSKGIGLFGPLRPNLLPAPHTPGPSTVPGMEARERDRGQGIFPAPSWLIVLPSLSVSQTAVDLLKLSALKIK